jgi:hypothetical protein
VDGAEDVAGDRAAAVAVAAVIDRRDDAAFQVIGRQGGVQGDRQGLLGDPTATQARQRSGRRRPAGGADPRSVHRAGRLLVTRPGHQERSRRRDSSVQVGTPDDQRDQRRLEARRQVPGRVSVSQRGDLDPVLEGLIRTARPGKPDGRDPHDSPAALAVIERLPRSAGAT